VVTTKSQRKEALLGLARNLLRDTLADGAHESGLLHAVNVRVLLLLGEGTVAVRLGVVWNIGKGLSRGIGDIPTEGLELGWKSGLNELVGSEVNTCTALLHQLQIRGKVKECTCPPL
jgi:hypothetical protein